MLQQLRIYRIEEGKFDEFLRLWLAGVLTIRQAKGWEVQAWAVPEKNELVWILSCDCTREEWDEKERESITARPSESRSTLTPDSTLLTKRRAGSSHYRLNDSLWP